MKITLSTGTDEASDPKSRKKLAGLFVKPVAATSAAQGEGEDDDDDEAITPRRRRSKDKRNKKKRKSIGKKKDDVIGSDTDSKDDVRATLASLASEIEEHRAQIAKLEQRLSEMAQANGIDPSEYLRPKKETPPKYDDVSGENGEDDVKFGEDGEKTNSGDENNNNNNNNQQTSIYKAQKISKLERLMGRRDSLSKIQPFLMAETPDEAMKNAQMLWSSDHFKRVYGSRPVFSDKPEKEQAPKRRGHRASKSSSSAALAQNALASKHTPQGSEIPPPPTATSKEEEQPSTVTAETTKKDFGEAQPHVITSSITSSITSRGVNVADIHSPSAASAASPAAGRRRSSSCGSNSEGSCEPAAGLMINKKVDKLNKLTGRRDSISEIVELLDPKTPDEARECAKSLYTMEALKKKLGARPTRPVSMAVVLPHAGKKEGEPCECEECRGAALGKKEGAENEKKGKDSSSSSSSSSSTSSSTGSTSSDDDNNKYASGKPAMGTSCDSDSATTLNEVEGKPIAK